MNRLRRFRLVLSELALIAKSLKEILLLGLLLMAIVSMNHEQIIGWIIGRV